MLFNKLKTKNFIIVLVVSCVIFSTGIAFAHPENDSITHGEGVSKKVDMNSQNTGNNKPFINLNEFHSKWGCDLNGVHKKMTGTLSLDNSSDIKTTHIDFYGDDQFIKTYTIIAGEKPIIINEDITNIKKFSIVSDLQMTGNISDDETIKITMTFKGPKSNSKFGDITIE